MTHVWTQALKRALNPLQNKLYQRGSAASGDGSGGRDSVGSSGVSPSYIGLRFLPTATGVRLSFLLWIVYFFGCAGLLLCRLFSSGGEQGLLSRCGEGVSLQWLPSLCGRRCRARGRSSFRLPALQAPQPRAAQRLGCPEALWAFPGTGIEPTYPALADGLATTDPRGKPCFCFFKKTLS